VNVPEPLRAALSAAAARLKTLGRAAFARLKAIAAWGGRLVRGIPRPALFAAGATALLLAVSVAVVVLYFSRVVSRTMDGRRWNLPTRLYSDVWVVRPGDALAPDDVTRRLGRLRYAEVPRPPLLPGQYALSPNRVTVFVNDRETAWGRTPGAPAILEFSGRRVASVRRAEDGSFLPHVVFEPEVVGTVFDEKMQDRTLVTIDQVPKVLLDAILTTEDRDFFTHAGISPRRLVGAVLQGVTRRAGVRGTSTLTQQLVKNMFLTPERTLKRKGVEALMAIILESKYSKTQILEAYLNEIYLGQRGSVSVTGVEEASRFYFGKGVSRLELPEAALLAGLISSPGKYSPFRNAENARQRRAVVLRGMLEQKKIDKAAYDAALAAPLTRISSPPTGVVAPHFVDFVLSQAKEIPGFTKEDGSSVFTTLDPDMQQAAQAAVHKGLEDLEKKFKRLRPRGEEDQLQAALIALDPSTGSVRALVGGRDYQVSQFNRVVQARRQPGSLFKPFVYLTAFAKRDLVPPITPASLYADSPIALVWGKGEDETWSPKNYDGEYRGTMTARQALEQSINVPTVRIAVTQTAPGRTLLPDIVETARRAGISSPLKPYPSLALGSFETSPMEVAAAYCTFANGGFRVKPNALLGLVTPALRRMESKDEPIVRGADADAVSVLDSVLRGVVDRGTGGSARRLGAQGIFAGKTGTTNDGRDAWFVGFSPNLLVAVWVGFDDNRGLNLSGSHAALPIWADFVRRLPSHWFETPFPKTPGVVTASIDPTTGLLVTEECPASLDEVFLEGTEPKQRCPHGSGGIAPGPGIGGAGN
jgi:penicillin-binding protein 1B